MYWQIVCEHRALLPAVKGHGGSLDLRKARGLNHQLLVSALGIWCSDGAIYLSQAPQMIVYIFQRFPQVLCLLKNLK